MRFSICTFNIAHGRGLVESNWQGGSLQDRKKRLDQVASVIADCDIVVLQEVDFRAPWSYFLLNQHQYLKKSAGFDHGMTLANHRFFPRAGISILSRFPLTDREVIRLPQYSEVEGFFGYRKDALACTVTLGNNAIPQFHLIGVHLDFRGRTVTVPAGEKLISHTKQQKRFTVMAGDFNSTPLSFPNPRDDQPTALDSYVIVGNSGFHQVHLSQKT